jgi:hypothetical protein
VAASVAQHLPSPLGARLLRAAQDAYVFGMADVMLITAGMMFVGAVLMALFLPARAPKAKSAVDVDVRQAARVAS